MLKLVTDENEIIKYQEILEKTLKTTLASTKTASLGTPNGTFNIELNYNDDIWFGTFEEEIWYWNSFGLFNELDFNRTNKILLEINIKTSELSKHGGGFVIDEKSNVFLFHRGNLNHLKNRFLAWYRKNRNSLKTIDDGKKGEEVIIIGSIISKDFIKMFTTYVRDVSLFRTLVSEQKQETILHENDTDVSIDSFQRDFENTNLEQVERIIFVPKRDQKIVKKAKELANGKCRLCESNAPFKTPEGEPYLEVHHVIRLADDNEADSLDNVVALCPNCHRKMHSLEKEALKKDIEKLTKIAKSQK